MMTRNAHDAYNRALMSEQPIDELRAVASSLLDRGATRSDLLEDFEELRGQLQFEHRQADEDVVLEVMDDLSGFTSEHLRL